MTKTNKVETATVLILETFKLNGCLLDAGNKLVRSIGLTSAKWQVMGVLAVNPSMTVSQVAKNMGLSRQAVQQTANRLIAQKIIKPIHNPYHKSANLLQLTPAGQKKFEQAMALQQPWIKKLVAKISADNLYNTLDVLQNLRTKLEVENE